MYSTIYDEKMPVAVKIFRDGKILDNPAFSKEIQALKYEEYLIYLLQRDIDHPNIVTLFGTITHPYLGLVLELLHVDLHTCIYGNRGLTQMEKLEFAKDIASGLHYLHKVKKVIHRDIKPQNILVKDKGC